jgi:hypothetical protein
MSTFTQLEDNVYAVLRDSSKTFVLSVEVKGWINEAYLELVARQGLLRKPATGTTNADGEITLPSDFIKVDSFWVATDDPELNESPVVARDDIFLWHRNNTSSPDVTLYRIFNGTIETYPVAESRSYVLEYVYKPTALSAGSDVPVIPEELHVKLVNYARAHAKWKEGEQTEGDRYMGLYLDGLRRAAPVASDRESPGPIDFVPQLGYWD